MLTPLSRVCIQTQCVLQSPENAPGELPFEKGRQGDFSALAALFDI
jgi:hypothetical protein